jgi:hypothetical protein
VPGGLAALACASPAAGALLVSDLPTPVATVGTALVAGTLTGTALAALRGTTVARLTPNASSIETARARQARGVRARPEREGPRAGDRHTDHELAGNQQGAQ